MKTIARFQAPIDAHMFRAYLDSRGVKAYVFDEYVVQLAWFLSNAVGGVRVVVSDCDSNVATEECREYFGALRQGTSPLTVARFWPLVLLLSIMSGVPALIFGRRTVTDATPAVANDSPNDGPATSVGSSDGSDEGGHRCTPRSVGKS